MTLPADHAQRTQYILDAATSGTLDVHWTPLRVADRLDVLVTARPVKCDGVYFGAGAQLEQQVADAVGALLLTCKLLDLMYLARAVDLVPKSLYGATRPDGVKIDSSNMMDTATFEYHTSLLDEDIADRDGLAQTVGKPFVASNASSSTRATNYGWMLPKGTPSPWRGVPIYPSVTLTSEVIQQPGNAHGLTQDDYASTCQLVHRACLLDGKPRDLADIYSDAQLAALVSHEGPLKSVRQPGVPLFACHLNDAITGPSGEQLCPLTAPPIPFGRSRLRRALVGGGIGAAVGAIAAAGAVALRGGEDYGKTAALGAAAGAIVGAGVGALT